MTLPMPRPFAKPLFGISLPKGPAIIKHLPVVLSEQEASLPVRLVRVLERLHAHFTYLSEQIDQIERELCQQLGDAAPVCWRSPALPDHGQCCVGGTGDT